MRAGGFEGAVDRGVDCTEEQTLGRLAMFYTPSSTPFCPMCPENETSVALRSNCTDVIGQLQRPGYEDGEAKTDPGSRQLE
jgi:hypothetical protein